MKHFYLTTYYLTTYYLTFYYYPINIESLPNISTIFSNLPEAVFKIHGLSKRI